MKLLEWVIAIFLLWYVLPEVEAVVKENYYKEHPLPKVDRTKVLTTAFECSSIPYEFGGTSLETGIDCSYFVQHVFEENGIKLPRTASEQYMCGQKLRPNELYSGDLVFFQTYDFGPTHVGIVTSAAGADVEFIHASSIDGRVTISKLSNPLYAKRFIGGTRVCAL